jgi:drug/metabolite transporter (DMT)-like permease
MIHSHPGEWAALLTAFFWTITALAFESAGKRVGSLVVNLLRLSIALILSMIFLSIFRGRALPLDAPAHAWFWLSASGLVGLVGGDFLLFRAFIVIGARISMLIMASVPPLTALAGWLILGETLVPVQLLGMALTVAGISLVVLQRNPGKPQVMFSKPLAGVLLALGGALGQAAGLILSKYGMGDYNAFAATQIRVIAGLLGFAVLFTVLRRWERVPRALRNGRAMINVQIGATFGPFLGVSFSLVAIQHTEAGIAATIMSIVPVLIIPPAAIIFKERITFKEVAGAALAVAGIAILFLH